MAYEKWGLKSRISGYNNSCWVPYLENLCYLIKNEPSAIGKSNLSTLTTYIMGMHWQKIGALYFEFSILLNFF